MFGSLLALLFLEAVCLLAKPKPESEQGAPTGYVRTTSGQYYSGLIRPAAGRLVIHSDQGLVSLTSDEVAECVLGPEALRPPSEISGAGLGVLGLYHTEHGVWVQLEPTLDFDWRESGPLPGRADVRLSAEWFGEVVPPRDGTYTFYLSATGPARFELVGRMSLEIEADEAGQGEVSRSIGLQAGTGYALKLSFQPQKRPARVRVLWSGPQLPKSVMPSACLYPRSPSPTHRLESNCFRPDGLLATYYRDFDYRQPVWSRLEKVVGHTAPVLFPPDLCQSNHFAVRWTGALQVTENGRYHFYVRADEGMRLRVEHRQLLNRWGLRSPTEKLASMNLQPGVHRLALESRNSDDQFEVQLTWAPPDQPRQPLVGPSLRPVMPYTAAELAKSLPARRPPGVVLRDGTFLPGRIERVEETGVKLTWPGYRGLIPLAQIAMVLPSSSADRDPPLSWSRDETGLWLDTGEFLAGRIRRLEPGRVFLSSVLFGVRPFALDRHVRAVVLRQPLLPSYFTEVHLTNHARLHVGAFHFEDGILIVEHESLGRLPVAWQDVVWLRRHDETHRSVADR